MKQREWKLLGNELRSLREAHDLGQKTVVALSEETMDERKLRAYESGDQRPGRDRLIKMLHRAFQITEVSAINRFLKLGAYSALTPREIAESGFTSAAAVPLNVLQSVPKAGPPVAFRIEVRTLLALDGQGRESWRHEFETRFASGAYEGRGTDTRCTFGDIDGDGGVETLFVSVPLDFGSVGTTLFCFAEDGTLKWKFEPGKTIKDTRQEYFPPYFIGNVHIIPIPHSQPRILVSSNHYLHNPNQIAMLDSNGTLVSEYWHSGHLLYIAHSDINGDGVEEILLAGVNNGYRQATLVILDPRNVSGASAQPGRQILGFPSGTEKAVVLFPRTCLSENSPYNRVAGLHVTRERRIVVAIAEGVSEAKNPGVMIFELDFKLNILSARPDSHLQEAHRLQEIEGTLDHSWTEDENERLKSLVIIKGGL